MASTVWRGYITFGLLSIPVRLFRAARPERISLRRVQRVPASPAIGTPPVRSEKAHEQEADDEVDEKFAAFSAIENKLSASAKPSKASAVVGRQAEFVPPATEPELKPIKQAAVSASTGKTIVPEKNIVKAYEFEKEQFVELTPDELKSIVQKTATEMEIQEFVSLSEIDPVYYETSYYVVPEEAGSKAYALLYQSMQNSSLVAVSQLAMHGREHVVILRPGKMGMLAHTMFYQPEVHGDEEYRTDIDTVSDKELQLAQTLISSLTASFEPAKYRDTYQVQLEELIARKVAGKPTVAPAETAKKGSVVDITEALQRSLAALKKPVASDNAKQAVETTRTTKKRTRSAS